MINGKNVLGVIPARGGSKGLSRKNVRDFCGKPLIVWTIEAAIASEHIDTLIVSTDDLEIADIAKNAGALVPFIRSVELSTDLTKTIDVVEDAYRKYTKSSNLTFDLIALLEPTSPLRQAIDIDLAIEQLAFSSVATSIVGVSQVESQHPSFLFHLNKNELISPYLEASPEGIRRQDLSPIYFTEGSIYVSQTETLFDQKSYYQHKTLGYTLPKWKAIEIDDEYDFTMAEGLMRKMILNDE